MVTQVKGGSTGPGVGSKRSMVLVSKVPPTWGYSLVSGVSYHEYPECRR